MTLDIDHPSFRTGFARLARITAAMSAAGDGLVGGLKKAALGLEAAAILVGLYFLPTVPNETPTTVRLVPVW